MVKVKAVIVMEMLGRPKEHLVDTMKQLIDVIALEKGIKVTNKTIHEPKEITEKDKEGKLIPAIAGGQLYTNFSELELEADNVVDIIRLSFKYMPSHIEIIEPTKFEFNNFDVNAIVNEIVGKMHHYDALAKSAIMQNQNMARQLEALSGKKIEVPEKAKEEQKQDKKAKKSKK